MRMMRFPSRTGQVAPGANEHSAGGGQATRGSDSGLARCSVSESRRQRAERGTPHAIAPLRYFAGWCGPRSKAAVICAKGVGDALPSKPIAGIVDCCARATNGHEAVASPLSTPILIVPPRYSAWTAPAPVAVAKMMPSQAHHLRMIILPCFRVVPRSPSIVLCGIRLSDRADSAQEWSERASGSINLGLAIPRSLLGLPTR